MEGMASLRSQWHAAGVGRRGAVRCGRGMLFAAGMVLVSLGIALFIVVQSYFMQGITMTGFDVR